MKLDAKIIAKMEEQRKKAYKEALDEMEKYLAFTIRQFADGEIVEGDKLEEYLVRQLLFKFVNKK